MEASAPSGPSLALLFVPLFAFVSSVSSVLSSSGKLPALLAYLCRLNNKVVIDLITFEYYDVASRQADDVLLLSHNPEGHPDNKYLPCTHQEVGFVQDAPPGWSHQITPPRQNLFLIFKRRNSNVTRPGQ